MHRSPFFVGILALLVPLVAATNSFADQAFNRIATWPVAINLPADVDAKTETSAEIVAARSPRISPSTAT